MYDPTFEVELDSVIHALAFRDKFCLFILNVISVCFKPRPKCEIYYKNYPFNLLL